MNTSIRSVTLIIALALVAGVMVGNVAQAKPKPVVVGTDAEDDWGNNQNPDIAPLGDALGQELISGSIARKDASTLDFIITVKSLPSNGGVPEFSRYVWTMMVDGELIQLDGKWTNYSRGTCDPTGGTCPPPRDPGEAPFMVRGACVDQTAAVTCTEIGLVHATFDVAAGTITIPVPLELLGAKTGSKITNGTQAGSNFSGIWAIPSAWASQADMPKDELILTKTYTVPR